MSTTAEEIMTTRTTSIEVTATVGQALELLSELQVRLMTRDPRTLSPSDPLKDAIVALVDERFGALPVVDSRERLVGLVSYIDVLRFVLVAAKH